MNGFEIFLSILGCFFIIVSAIYLLFLIGYFVFLVFKEERESQKKLDDIVDC